MMLFLNIWFIFACLFKLSTSTHSDIQPADSNDHLVVLSHGIMGNRNNLGFLSKQLQKLGCTVLQSSANEYFNSHKGIALGAKKLANEIKMAISRSPKLQRISFIGNSMGGLYARYAIMILYNQKDLTIGGLLPQNFLVC
jgi:triacylglycerol esterase/lipase EstA (alpha/beta hydrolase family)